MHADYTQLYLSADARRRVDTDQSLLRPALDALGTVHGVDRAFPSAGLDHEHASADPAIRAAALSHVPGRSGDIVVIPKPYFVVGAATASGATHGTLHYYDQHVPLIFFGAGIKAGRLATPAPRRPGAHPRTCLGVALPNVDGRAGSGARPTLTLTTVADGQFAARVLSVVKRIPVGRVTTYGDVARLASRRARRAVGTITERRPATCPITGSSPPAACSAVTPTCRSSAPCWRQRV